jgi:hypothetical protein
MSARKDLMLLTGFVFLDSDKRGGNRVPPLT